MRVALAALALPPLALALLACGSSRATGPLAVDGGTGRSDAAAQEGGLPDGTPADAASIGDAM